MATPKDPRQGRPPGLPGGAPDDTLSSPPRPELRSSSARPLSSQRPVSGPSAAPPSLPRRPSAPTPARPESAQGRAPATPAVQDPQFSADAIDLAAVMASLDSEVEAGGRHPESLEDAVEVEILDDDAISFGDVTPSSSGRAVDDQARAFVSGLPGIDLERTGPQPVETFPRLEGIEMTSVGETQEPRRRRKAAPAVEESAAVPFSYATCPGCGTEQPQPSPNFCDSCGTRLLTPSRKKGARGAEGSKRCGDCGFKSGEEAVACTNCGTRLPA